MNTKIVKIGFNLKIGYPKLSWLIVFIPVEIAYNKGFCSYFLAKPNPQIHSNPSFKVAFMAIY